MRLCYFVLPIALLSACTQQSVSRVIPSAGQVDLAKQVLATVQPISLQENVEYCGEIGLNARGQIVASGAARGRVNTCKSNESSNIVTVTASYHTHGGFSQNYFNELPSMSDVNADLSEGIDGYVATPGGRIWFVDTTARRVTQICGLGCLPQAANFVEQANGPIQQTYSFDALAQRLDR